MASKKEDIPQWVIDGIRSAKFGKPRPWKGTGHILEVYDPDDRIDVQLNKPVEDGRHIVTVDLSGCIKDSALEKGAVYELAPDCFRAPLEKKVAEFLQKEKGMDMDAVSKFELRGLVPIK